MTEAPPAPNTTQAEDTPAEQPRSPGKFLNAVKAQIPSDTPAALAAPEPPKPVAPAASAPVKPTESALAKPAESAKPAATDDDVDVELPKNISGAKAEDWQKLISQRDKYKTRAQTIQDQLKAKDEEITKYKSKPPVDPEIQTQLETLKKQNEEYSGYLKRVAIEQSPEFQAHFKPRFEQAIASAKEAAGEHGDKIVALLEATPSKWRKKELDAVLAEIESESDKMGLRLAFNDYDKVRNERAAEIANANSNFEQMKAMQAKKAEQREKENAEIRQRNLDAAMKKAEAVEAFKPIEGNAEHNALVESNKAMLRKFMTHEGLSIEEYMDAPIQAGEAKRLKGVVDAQAKELAELKAAVAEYKGTSPGARGGEAATGAEEGVETFYGKSKFKSAVRKIIQGPGA